MFRRKDKQNQTPEGMEDVIKNSQIQLESVDLNVIRIDYAAVGRLDPAFAKSYRVFPFALRNKEMHVAIGGLESLPALQKFGNEEQIKIHAYLSDYDTIMYFINEYYNENDDLDDKDYEIDENYDKSTGTVKLVDKPSEVYKDRDAELENPQIVDKFVREMIFTGVKMKASDIHIENVDDFAYIRFRVDGRMMFLKQMPKMKFKYVANKLKVMAEFFVVESAMPQKGKVTLAVDKDKKFSFEVLTLPTSNCEKILIKLDRMKSVIPFNEIGMSKDDVEALDEILDKKSGMFIITGLSGSGRTSTLYAVAKKLVSKENNIIMIVNETGENISGINQVVLPLVKGVDLDKLLKTIYEHDPDIIAVDVPDLDSATMKYLSNLALSGKLVICTMYFPTAFDTIEGIISMGIDNYTVASAVEGILAQTLLRRHCPKCKGTKKDNDEVCGECSGIGYRGKIGVFEVIRLGRKYFSTIIKQDNEKELKDKLSREISTFERNCLRLYELGITSKREILSMGVGRAGIELMDTYSTKAETGNAEENTIENKNIFEESTFDERPNKKSASDKDLFSMFDTEE